MSTLILPEYVARNLLTQQEREWTPRLQAIDPLLRLVPPMPNPPAGMIPNRWHISRLRDDDNTVHIPILGPGGAFREPDEAILEEMRRMDAHSSRTRDEWSEARRRRHESAERDKARLRADRVGELAERIRVAENPSIRVPRSI